MRYTLRAISLSATHQISTICVARISPATRGRTPAIRHGFRGTEGKRKGKRKREDSLMRKREGSEGGEIRQEEGHFDRRNRFPFRPLSRFRSLRAFAIKRLSRF